MESNDYKEFTNYVNTITTNILLKLNDAETEFMELLITKFNEKCEYIEKIERKLKEQKRINEEHRILNGKLRKQQTEVIKYVLNNKLYTFKYDDEELFEITTDKPAKDKILKILGDSNE